MNVENTKAQMRKGVLEFCVLSILSNERMYASDILRTLKEAELIVVEGTLYPLLSRLKKGGLLKYEWEESISGPPRKYYTLTETGVGFWKDLHSTWDQLENAVKITIKNS